jgi:hypothetical protein
MGYLIVRLQHFSFHSDKSIMTWMHLGEDSFLPHQWPNVVFLYDDYGTHP